MNILATYSSLKNDSYEIKFSYGCDGENVFMGEKYMLSNIADEEEERRSESMQKYSYSLQHDDDFLKIMVKRDKETNERMYDVVVSETLNYYFYIDRIIVSKNGKIGEIINIAEKVAKYLGFKFFENYI